MTRMWRTSGARFNAVRRLRLRNKLSIFSIAAFSLIGIILSVFEIVYGLPDGVSHNFTFLALAISLFVLVISLLEGAASYEVRAERLSRNAVQIEAERSGLESVIAEFKDGNRKATKKFDLYREKYDHLINECPENHRPMDDLLFRIQHRKSPEFKTETIGRMKITSGYVVYYGYSAWLFLVLWILLFYCIYLVVKPFC